MSDVKKALNRGKELLNGVLTDYADQIEEAFFEEDDKESVSINLSLKW